MALPPGSMASIMTYAPHGVDCKRAGSETRWASLFAYATVDPTTKARRLRHFPFADWGERDLGVPGAERLMNEF